MARWQVQGATLTGPGHLARGTGNQDAWRACLLDAGAVVFAAVADGAGSLARSGEGAEIAVDAAVAACSEAHTAGHELVSAVHAGVEAARGALLTDGAAAELGSTLTLVGAGPEGWASGQVGDSFAVLAAEGSPQRRLQLLRPGPAGEYANLTQLLTSPDPDPLFAEEAETLEGLFVSSDGLAQLTLGPSGAHEGFYRPLLTRARRGQLEVPALLRWLDDAGRLEDDTTLVAAWRLP